MLGKPSVNLNARLMCPRCCVDPPDIEDQFQNAGGLICSNCGLVLASGNTRDIDWDESFRVNVISDFVLVGNGSDPLMNGAAIEYYKKLNLHDPHVPDIFTDEITLEPEESWIRRSIETEWSGWLPDPLQLHRTKRLFVKPAPSS